MKIQFGSIITGGSGSVGGTTVQKNGSGYIMRIRGISSKGITNKQQLSHQEHQQRLCEWNNLTLENKQLWNLYANVYEKTNKYGVAKKLSGLNWYESVNTQLVTIGQPITSTPPPHNSPSEIVPFSVQISAGTIKLIFDIQTTNPDNSLIIWGTYFTTRSTFSVNRLRKRIMIRNTNLFTDIDITNAWCTCFGVDSSIIPIHVGKYIIICLQSINKISGISSSFLCAIGTVAITTNVYITTDSGEHLQTDSNDNLIL